MDSSGRLTPSHDLLVLLNVEYGRFVLVQIEEMYNAPESFLEIEVRNPQTHGECRPLAICAPGGREGMVTGLEGERES